MTAAELRRAVDAARTEHEHARRTARDAGDELTDARANLTYAESARAIVQETAARVQRDAHGRIARVVSAALSAVFGDAAYQFRVVFEQKRGRTEARLAFVRNGREYAPSEVGGGVLDVGAFGLRMAALAFARPPVRPLLVLDEPFKMLSRAFVPRACALLESVAADRGVQILQVTHNPALAAGTVTGIGE